MLRRSSGEFEPDPPDYDEEPDRPRRQRRPRIGGRKTTVMLVVLALVFLGVAVLRLFSIDGNQYMIPAAALTPYVAAGALLLAGLTFLLRRRIFAAALLLIALSLAVLLLPRYFSDDQPAATGEHVRVMSANLDEGGADAAAIVKAVRDNKVDVLNVLELTQAALSKLDEAGLADELPHRVFEPGAGDQGSGIASRFPLRKIVPVEGSVIAVVDLAGQADVEVVAVRVRSAVRGSVDTWRRELDALPGPTPNERVRVLAGDFNATFDHAPFRGLVDRGYADAAEQTGRGLAATWSSWLFGPPITIDHLLVDGRCAVVGYDVVDLPGSDHNAVFAELVLPN